MRLNRLKISFETNLKARANAHARVRLGDNAMLVLLRSVIVRSVFPGATKQSGLQQSLDTFTYANILGGDSGGVTPVPIPNTVVKPAYVDGTALERVWESRKPPG